MGVCFWPINECWLEACEVWVRGVRKNSEKIGQKIAEICRNLTKVIKSAHFLSKICKNVQKVSFIVINLQKIRRICILTFC